MDGIIMPRSLSDIFNEFPEVEVIEFVSYDDGGPFGLSCEGRKLKIGNDPDFAKKLATLEGANTETGFISGDGYYIHGSYDFNADGYKAYVYRLPPAKRTVT
jgi:hypothetical protein